METVVSRQSQDSEERSFEVFALFGGTFFVAALTILTALALFSMQFVVSAHVAALRSSFLVAGLALIVAVPLGFGAGVYVSLLLTGKARAMASRSLDMVGVVPSVIWAIPCAAALMDVRAAPLRAVGLAGLALGLALAPGFAASVRDWLDNAPPDLVDQSLLLGARPWSTLRVVLMPYARRGLIGTIGTLFARAVGEAIVVTLVLGEVPSQTLGGALSVASGEAFDVRAVMAMAGLLLLATLPLQILSRAWAHSTPAQSRSLAVPVLERGAHVFAGVSYGLLLTALVCICAWLVRRASGAWSETLSGALNGVLLTTASMFLGAPLGIAGAVCLVEFPERRWARPVRFAGELLLSIPPVVIGVFALVIGRGLGLPTVGYATLALSLMMAPSVMRRTTRVLRSVSRASRHSALELGASRVRTFWIVVMGGARRPLVGGLLAAAARTLGSTSALLFVPHLRVPATLAFRHARASEIGPSATAGAALMVLVLGLKAFSHYLTEIRPTRVLVGSRTNNERGVHG